MEHAEIARRLPTVSHGIKAAVADVESMVDELAGLPAGHERAGQIKQQVHSKLFMATRDLDEMQPDAPKPQPVAAKVDGDGFGPEGHAGDRPHFGDNTVGSKYASNNEGSDLGSREPGNDVVEMEKKIDDEWLGVTVWASSAPHLERDGWTRVSAPREVEEGEKPVEHSADTVDHDADHDAGGEEFGAHGHAGDGTHFGDGALNGSSDASRGTLTNADQHRAVDGDNADLEGTDVSNEGHAGGDPANAMPQADSTGKVKGRSSLTPNDAHHTPGQDKADA